MNKFLLNFPALAALFLAFFSVCFAEEEVQDHPLQGVWKIQLINDDGEEEVPTPLITLEFDKGVIIRSIDGEKTKGTYKLDDTQEPRWVNITMDEYGDQELALAIYQLEDDQLILAIMNENEDKIRPSSFKPEEGKAIATLKLVAETVKEQ